MPKGIGYGPGAMKKMVKKTKVKRKQTIAKPRLKAKRKAPKRMSY